MWYVHTMEYYSTIKRNDILIHAPTCTLKTESERSLMQKAPYYVIPLMRTVQNTQREKIDQWLPGAKKEGMESDC